MARRTAFVLLGIDLLLVGAYLLDVGLGNPSWTLHQLVNLDAEATVPAWYTSGKLLLAGVLFLLLAGQQLKSAVVSRPFLLLVSLAFILLSLDETAGLHEQMTLSLRRFEALPRFSGNHGMWIPFLLVGLTAFLAATAPHWRRLWRRERRGTMLLGLGLALGMTGAVSLEILSYEVIRPAGDQTLYMLEVAAEEGLEMLGASVLLIGSMRVFLTGVAADGAPTEGLPC